MMPIKIPEKKTGLRNGQPDLNSVCVAYTLLSLLLSENLLQYAPVVKMKSHSKIIQFRVGIFFMST